MKTNRVLTTVLVVTLLTLTGCKKESEDSSSSTASISATDIAKSWTSNCTAAASADPVTGGTHFIVSLYVGADNTFSYNQMWFTTSNCTGAGTVAYSVLGAYSIASINGVASADGFGLVFFATSSTIMGMVDATQGQFNTACGGTSPYGGTTNSAQNGVAKNSYGTMICGGMVFANSTDDTFYNVATFTNGVLAIGDGAYSGLPGVPENATTPPSASISLH